MGCEHYFLYIIFSLPHTPIFSLLPSHRYTISLHWVIDTVQTMCTPAHISSMISFFVLFFCHFLSFFDENIISCRILFSYKWKLICCAWGIEETLGERKEYTPESVNMSFLFFRSMPAQSAWRYVNARLILLFFAKWMPITATSNVHAFFWLRKVPRILYFL